MVSILINAYACAPNMGSEPGMAWNWIINLANYCKVYVITEGEWRTEIELAIKELPQKQNIVFHYIPVSEKIRKICWNQGDWRFYFYYRKWQKKALIIAKEIINKNQIDLLHQLNMIGFREPGYLWKIENKPFIWGPIDAKASFPVKYLQGADITTASILMLKNVLTHIQLKTSRRVRKALKKANTVVSASSESVKTLQNYFDYNSVLINETGCYVKKMPDTLTIVKKKSLDILWVGKLDFRKQLALALQTIDIINIPDIKLHIIGDDKNPEGEYYKNMATSLKITHRCIWHGKIPHKKVQEIMRDCDLFFFTSVAEGTPHVVLEAIGNNLPILCFNTCGQGDSVNEKIGIKIELSSFNQSVKDFSSKIEYLYNNREVLVDLSNNCYERQLELSWNNKANQMIELYKKAIGDFIV